MIMFTLHTFLMFLFSIIYGVFLAITSFIVVWSIENKKLPKGIIEWIVIVVTIILTIIILFF